MDVDKPQPGVAPQCAAEAEDTAMEYVTTSKEGDGVDGNRNHVNQKLSEDVKMKDAAEPESQAATVQDAASYGEQAEVASTKNTSVLSDAPEPPQPRKKETGFQDKCASSAASATSNAAKSSSKMAREREDEPGDQPAAKRIRTEPPEADTEPTGAAGAAARAEAPQPAYVSGEAEATPTPPDDWARYNDPERDNESLTSNMLRDAKKAIAGIKKTKMGEKLSSPVEINWPELSESYAAVIKNPMDFGKMERNLKEGHYKMLRALKDDAILIYANCCQFNGVSHGITLQAHGYVERVMEALKQAGHDKSRLHRKDSKPVPTPAKRQTEPRTATKKPRRESPAAPATSSAPRVTGESPTFAPAPSGMPLIRRDSTKNAEDKRPIVPPKNKDLEYASKSQKKKLTGEMKFYEELLNQLMSQKHGSLNGPFLMPVDPVALNIPTYFQVIKKPIDLSTIRERIDSGHYKKGKDIEADLNLMFKNCYKFNPVGNFIHDTGKQLEEVCRRLLAEKDAWMKKNAPPTSQPKPPRRAQESDSEDSIADEGEGAEDEASADVRVLNQTIKALENRVKEESDKISKELAKSTPDESLVSISQMLLNTLQTQLIQEKKKMAETKKQPVSKPKQSKSGKPSKPSVSSQKKASATKKAGGSSKKVSKPKRGEPTDKHRTAVTDGILQLGDPDMERCIEIIKKDTNQQVGLFHCEGIDPLLIGSCVTSRANMGVTEQ